MDFPLSISELILRAQAADQLWVHHQPHHKSNKRPSASLKSHPKIPGTFAVFVNSLYLIFNTWMGFLSEKKYCYHMLLRFSIKSEHM